MRRNLFLFFLFCFFSSPNFSVLAQPQSIQAQADKLRAFNYEKATDISAMEGFARDKAQTFLATHFTNQAQQWVSDAEAKWAEMKGLPTSLGSQYLRAMQQEGRFRVNGQVDKYAEFLKAELTNRMKLEMPKQVDSFIRDELLHSTENPLGDAAVDMEKMIEKISGNVLGDVEQMVTGTVTAWSQALASPTLRGMQGMVHQGVMLTSDPASMVPLMTKQLTDSMGKATKVGIEEFIDSKMFEQFGEGFAGKIEEQMKSAADAIEGLGDLASGDMGAIRGQLEEALKDSPLSGLGVEEYASYFDQMLAQKVHDMNVPEVSLPNLEIPTPAYAGILLGSAATHFGRCCGFLYFKYWEIERGIRLIKLAVWQLKHRPDSFMLVGGDLTGRGLLGGHGKELSEASVKKLEDAISKMESASEKTERAEALKSIQGVIADMDKVKAELDQMFLDMQKEISAQVDKVAEQVVEVTNKVTEPLKKVEDCLSDPLACGYKKISSDTANQNTAGTNNTAIISEQADQDSPLDPVILATGEFLLESSDLKIKGRGLEIDFKRHYRNQWERIGPLGYNWTHQYDEKLLTDEKTGDQVHQLSNGLRYLYRKTLEESYLPPPGQFKTLSPTDAGHTLTDENKLVHHFNKAGNLTAIKDNFGNELKFEYSLAGDKKVLSRITDSLGQTLELKYNPDGTLASIRDNLNREVVYSYNNDHDLLSVRSPLTEEYPKGQLSRYRYSGGHLEPSLNHNINLIMDPKGQIYLRNTYGNENLEKDRIIAQTFGDKDIHEMKVKYEVVNKDETKTIVTDRNGNDHVYTHNNRGLRLSYLNPPPSNPPLPLREIYAYNSDDLLIKKTDIIGRTEIFSYNDQTPDRAAQNKLIEHKITAENENGLTIKYNYDTNNQLMKKEFIGASKTRTETYAYTEAGQIKQITTGPLTKTYTYNEHGQRITETQGQKTRSYQYEGANLVKIIEQSGEQQRSTQLTYDLYGNVAQVIDPEQNKTLYWYNALNLMIQKQDAGGNKTNFSYDANNNLVELIRENKGGNNVEEIGHQLAERYSYNTLDKLIKKEVQVNRDQWMNETYNYDAGENLIEQKNFNGIRKQYVYNGRNQVIQEKINDEVIKTNLYNETGQLIETADALGHKQSYQWDALGRIKRYTSADGTNLKLGYTEFGETHGYQARSTQDELLQEVSFSYDELGRRTQEARRKLGTDEWITKNFAYQDNQLKEISDVLGVIKTFAYDGFGELSQIADPAQNIIELDRNNNGQITQKKISNGKFQLKENYSYDGLGRIIQITDAKGNASKKVYDALGNLINDINPLNQAISYSYDGLGRLLSEQAGERSRKLSWNENGFIAGLIDGANRERSYSYDNRGRKISETEPDGMVRQYQYNQINQLIQMSVAGASYTQTYDALGRLTKRQSQDAYVQEFSYDPLGRLITAKDTNDPVTTVDDVVTQYSYDTQSNLIKEVSNNYTLQRSYDERGRNTQIIYPSGEVVTQSFNEAGWLKEVTSNGQSLGSYDYALMGLSETEHLGNGISRNISYDGLMQVIQDSYQTQNKKIAQTNYSYDQLGRVIQKESVTERKWESFKYNDQDQLESAEIKADNKITKRSYAYDFEGQWKEILEQENNQETKTPITAGPGYRYEQFGTAKLSYDARGNLTGDGKHNFKYDAWNRLIEVSQAEGNKSIAKYSYDVHNRRVTKQTPEKIPSPLEGEGQGEGSLAITRTINFTYNYWNLIEEYENKKPTRTYYHGKTMDNPVALKTNEAIYFYHKDQQGSITAISDQNKEIVEKYSYDEYGNLKNNPSIKTPLPEGERAVGRVNNPLTYTAQYKDEETDFYYYKNRYYSSKLGRFLTKDPLGLINGPNTYAYVNNNPTNSEDPMGTWTTDIHNQLVKNAFGNLTEQQIKAIQQGSINTDDDQSLESSYKHAMRSPDQSVQDAERLMEQFIDEKMRLYQTSILEGRELDAYQVLGEALHPVMDSTSPAHEGFQVWEGLSHPYDAYKHYQKEKTISPQKQNETISKMLEVYNKYKIGIKKCNRNVDKIIEEHPSYQNSDDVGSITEEPPFSTGNDSAPYLSASDGSLLNDRWSLDGSLEINF